MNITRRIAALRLLRPSEAAANRKTATLRNGKRKSPRSRLRTGSIRYRKMPCCSPVRRSCTHHVQPVSVPLETGEQRKAARRNRCRPLPGKCRCRMQRHLRRGVARGWEATAGTVRGRPASIGRRRLPTAHRPRVSVFGQMMICEEIGIGQKQCQVTVGQQRDFHLGRALIFRCPKVTHPSCNGHSFSAE